MEEIFTEMKAHLKVLVDECNSIKASLTKFKKFLKESAIGMGSHNI